MTTIKKCNCKSSFQDVLYGLLMRVMNLKANGKQATCTVCGAIHQVDKWLPFTLLCAFLMDGYFALTMRQM